MSLVDDYVYCPSFKSVLSWGVRDGPELMYMIKSVSYWYGGGDGDDDDDMKGAL